MNGNFYIACRKQRNLMGIVTSELISTIELSDDLNSSKFEYLNNYKITCSVRSLILRHILVVAFLFFVLSLFFLVILRFFLLFSFFFLIPIIDLLLFRRFCGSLSVSVRRRSAWLPVPGIDVTVTISADLRSLKNVVHLIVR